VLKNKKILLAVTGSIAAYKSAFLVRLLVKKGADVKVVLSESATSFVTPLTLGTLSKNAVVTSFVSSGDGTWNNHVELGLWADAMIVAPATAKTLSGMANGYCENLLLACYLSAKCPVFFAPAMDLDMFKHPSTVENIEKLVSNGNHLIAAGTGELASGLEGEGRMAEPEEIVASLHDYFEDQLNGKRVLITAGPTYEAIDPVRFIGNRSTGKMGYALAQELINRGYLVDLVSGPSNLPAPEGLNSIINVESASEMYKSAIELSGQADICIMAAAVADYTPETVSDEKIKKSDADLAISLQRTQDILAHIGKHKKPNQVIVGFALETQNEEANALGKLERKNADLIVLNSLRTGGAGFGHDTNQVTFFTKEGKQKEFGLKSKKAVAKDIVLFIENELM